MITIDDFKKVEIRVGEILAVEKIPDSDKLLKLSVGMGEEKPRQILSGISKYFPEHEKLVGLKCAFVANLEPRMIMGFESQGMIMAVSNDTGTFSLFTVDKDIPAGTQAR
jgi:methionine--tRNA ligase beta chain